MGTDKERADALFHLRDGAARELHPGEFKCCIEAAHILRDCVPVPRDELARYKRALLVGMRDAGYPNRVAWDPNNQVADIMFLEAGLIFAGGDWTDAAHDFAKEQVAEK